MEATLKMFDEKYGSVEVYLLKVARLTPKEISAVRRRQLEPFRDGGYGRSLRSRVSKYRLINGRN